MREMCPDKNCGSYEGHHPKCELASDEYKARQLEFYYELWLKQEKESQATFKKQKEQITFWQGKFRIVCQENNSLRRKLRNRNRS